VAMKRRDVIVLASGGILAWTPFAHAQPSQKVRRVAFLVVDSGTGNVRSALFDVFRDELRRLGYVDGNNLVIERRTAHGQVERLDQLVGELIALKPDVIVAAATPAVAAAQRATSTIPIVMWGVSDAVALGFIESLAHPGRNLTGVASMFSDTVGKSLELLQSILPSAKRVAVLATPSPVRERQIKEAEAAAKALSLEPFPILASLAENLEATFEDMMQKKCDALLVLAGPIEPKFVALAASNKIPAVYQFSAYVELGGLASYGANLAMMGKQTAQYVARILQGAKPAELPVEQPVAFELALNLKTAGALGLTIPPAVIARADKVIE
jgi:putative tryptophan/tyrosine transport system substrate-binding protein